MTTDNKNQKHWVNRLINLDRRVVYLVTLAAIVLPFFLTPVVNMKGTKWVKTAYDLVEEAAKIRKPILIGFDYDPSTMAELQPMSKAILRHAFSKNVKVVGINFSPNGTALAASTLDEIAKEYGKVYGEDYVFLGFMTQYDIVLINLGDDLRKSYQQDYRGLKIDQIPMLKNIQNYNDFHIVICLAGTSMPKAYIVYGVAKYGFNYVAGVTAVSATEYFTYLNTGQMKGLLAGMKAAAEYEFMINKLGDGMRGMASQTWGHLAIIIFIIIGNVLFFVKRKIDQEKSGE